MSIFKFLFYKALVICSGVEIIPKDAMLDKTISRSNSPELHCKKDEDDDIFTKIPNYEEEEKNYNNIYSKLLLEFNDIKREQYKIYSTNPYIAAISNEKIVKTHDSSSNIPKTIITSLHLDDTNFKNSKSNNENSKTIQDPSSAKIISPEDVIELNGDIKAKKIVYDHDEDCFEFFEETDLNGIMELKYLLIALKLLKETDRKYIFANHAEAHNEVYVICLLKAKTQFVDFFFSYYELLKSNCFHYKSTIQQLQSNLENIIAEDKQNILPKFFLNWLEAMIDCLGYPYCLAFIDQTEEKRSTKIALEHFVDFFIMSFRYNKMKDYFDNLCNKDSFVHKYKDLVLYKINSVSLRNIIVKDPASNLQESKQENSEQKERDIKCLPASQSNISMGNSIKDWKNAFEDNNVHSNPSKTIYKDQKNLNDMDESEINDYLDKINSELDILRKEIFNLKDINCDFSQIENLKEIQQALNLVNNAFEERIVLKKLVEENMIRRDIIRRTQVNKKKSGFKIGDVKINSMKETSSDRVFLTHLAEILEKHTEQGNPKRTEKNESFHIQGKNNSIKYDHSQHFHFNFNSS